MRRIERSGRRVGAPPRRPRPGSTRCKIESTDAGDTELRYLSQQIGLRSHRALVASIDETYPPTRPTNEVDLISDLRNGQTGFAVIAARACPRPAYRSSPRCRIGAFPMARRRELLVESPGAGRRCLRPPVELGAGDGGTSRRAGGRQHPRQDLTFVPLRLERVVEVRYGPWTTRGSFTRRSSCAGDPTSCRDAQLDVPVPFDVADAWPARPERVPQRADFGRRLDR
jgi:hypothetical protein